MFGKSTRVFTLIRGQASTVLSEFVVTSIIFTFGSSTYTLCGLTNLTNLLVLIRMFLSRCWSIFIVHLHVIVHSNWILLLNALGLMHWLHLLNLICHSVMIKPLVLVLVFKLRLSLIIRLIEVSSIISTSQEVFSQWTSRFDMPKLIAPIATNLNLIILSNQLCSFRPFLALLLPFHMLSALLSQVLSNFSQS